MLGQGFAASGLHIAIGDRPIRRYQVFGERSSGTNFVKRLIGRNTPLIPTEALGWKHGPPHMTAIPADTAILCVVRDARSWALSMHARPWHCPPEMQALPFSEFIRAPWRSVADRPRYFPQVAELGGEGRPLQLDRDPATGQPYPDIFALRRGKLSGLLTFLSRDCTVVFMRLETVQKDPEQLVDTLLTSAGLPPRDKPLRPVVKRLGSRFLPAVAPRPQTPQALPDADLDFLRSRIDPAQEALLGYSYA